MNHLVRLSDLQRRWLKALARSDVGLAARRAKAVLLGSLGKSFAQAGEMIGSSTRSVRRWVEAFERDGLAGVLGKPALKVPALREASIRVLKKQLQEVHPSITLRVKDGEVMGAEVKGRELSTDELLGMILNLYAKLKTSAAKLGLQWKVSA